MTVESGLEGGEGVVWRVEVLQARGAVYLWRSPSQRQIQRYTECAQA